jgi:hypothetical protein
LKYELDLATQDITDALAEAEASKATATTLDKEIKDGSYKYDATNTLKSVQDAYYGAVKFMAGNGQLLGM